MCHGRVCARTEDRLWPVLCQKWQWAVLETGDLLAVTAAGELNIWRTGAPAGIGSRYLALPGARSFGIVGSGRQARGQLLAVRRAVPMGSRSTSVKGTIGKGGPS